MKKKPVERIKLEHKPLHCPVCGDRFMNIFGQPLPNHSQLRCKTVSGNEMDLGVCGKCVEKGVSMEMCQAILEGIKDFWTHEVDVNKSLRPDEKTNRKAFHNSHQIHSIQNIIQTGKRAEKEARRKGKLI